MLPIPIRTWWLDREEAEQEKRAEAQRAAAAKNKGPAR